MHTYIYIYISDAGMIYLTQAYARIVCALLDIPVHAGNDALTESLHHLFTLYSEFKANQQDALAMDSQWG